MTYAGILLFANVSVIVLMLLLQRVSVRITRLNTLTVSIEYFPLKLVLYDFNKIKIKKRRLRKRAKRMVFFLNPILKSIRYLLKRAKISLKAFPSYEQIFDEPHTFFLIRAIENSLKSYILSTLISQAPQTNTTNFSDSYEAKEQSLSTKLDLELSTKLYQVLLTPLVFIFFSIKKKGRTKGIV